MAGFAAFQQAQGTAGDEATNGPADGIVRETRAASEPGNGETEAKPSLEAAVTKEMRIDDAVGNRQAKTRNKEVLELFPQVFGIGLGFHGCDPEES